MNLFYGPKFKPYSVTAEQGEIASNIYEKLVRNDRFSELIDVAVVGSENGRTRWANKDGKKFEEIYQKSI